MFYFGILWYGEFGIGDFYDKILGIVGGHWVEVMGLSLSEVRPLASIEQSGQCKRGRI